MALRYFRSLLSQRQQRAQYTQLPHHRHCQSGSSSDAGSIAPSHITSIEERSYTEKNPRDSSETLQFTTKAAFLTPRLLADLTLGLSDGLTVPFALTVGLSALGKTDVVIYGGLAELMAGAISMGLGGYLGAKGEVDAYHAQVREVRELLLGDDGESATSVVRECLLRATGSAFRESLMGGVMEGLRESPQDMVEFVTRLKYGSCATENEGSRAWISGATISLGYVSGGLVALLPYLSFQDVAMAFWASVTLISIALFAFGWARAVLNGEIARWSCFKDGVQMTTMGGIAALAAMGCVKAVVAD